MPNLVLQGRRVGVWFIGIRFPQSGANEQRQNITLAADLRHNAMAIVNAVELALSEPSGSNVVSNTSVNREDDKFYSVL